MKKLTLIMTLLIFSFTSLTTWAAFDDVDYSVYDWAEEAIESLYSEGIVNGYEDGSFRPEGNVTRAEFAKMLCVAFDCNEAYELSYTDVSEHWAEEYISKTDKLVYCTGELYKPDDFATREEIAYAVANAVKTRFDIENTDDGNTVFLNDYDLVNDDMQGNIVFAVASGIVKGYEDGTFKPQNFVTRAEVSVLIHRAMNYELEKEPEVEEPETGSGNDVENEDKNEQSSGISDRDPDGPSEEVYDELLEKGHIYTLYPHKYLLEVVSVTMLYNDDGEENYKIIYRLGGDDEEYESVVDGDTVVLGVKNDISNVKSGDVMILDTGFWGEIGCLYVISSPKYNGRFSYECPSASNWCAYPGSADYELAAGELIMAEASSKSYNLSIKNENGDFEITVPKSVNVDVYDMSGKRSTWETDDLSALRDVENTYVMVRFVDGRAAEVVAYMY